MASGRRHERRSLAARLLEALFHASFGGFLLRLVFVVVRTPVHPDQVLTAVAGKLAFLLTVGAVAVSWLLLAVMIATGADEAPALPAALAELCPACGHLGRAASDLPCPRCGLGPTYARRWQGPAHVSPRAMVAMAALLGSSCLAMFWLFSSPAWPSGLLPLLASVVVPLSPVAIGLLAVGQIARHLRRSRPERGRYRVQVRPRHRMDVPCIEATALLGPRGQLVHAVGSSTWQPAEGEGRTLRWTRQPSAAAGASGYRLDPGAPGWTCEERRWPAGDGAAPLGGE